MLHASTKWIAPIVAVLALTAAQAPSARAGLTLDIYEDGVLEATFFDSATPGSIALLGTDVNPFLLYFNLDTLNVTSNILTATPDGTIAPQLQLGGTNVNRFGPTVTDPTGTHTLSFVATEDAFSLTGNPKVMNTSASNTFGNAAAGTVRTFQSTFDDGSSPPVSSTLATFIPTVGNLSPSQPDQNTPLGNTLSTFTLSSTTAITLGPATNRQNVASFGSTTTLNATAIPEPSSMALSLISLPALLALGRRMRRRTDV